MRGASTIGLRARSVALLALGALAVHQGRYLLASASGDHGHGYLELLGPVIVLGTVAAIAVSFLATLALRCLPVAPAPEQATDRAVLFAVGLPSTSSRRPARRCWPPTITPSSSHLLGSEAGSSAAGDELRGARRARR